MGISTEMKIRTSYVCHPGKKRTCNQDNLYYQGIVLRKNHGSKRQMFSQKWDTGRLLCFGVFDGMGGEQHGERASYLAAGITKEAMDRYTGKKLPSDLLYEICKKANTEVYRKTVELGAERIGTTAAMVMFRYDTIWCCNIGDSKIFRLRENQLEQLSMDHVAAFSDRPDKKPGLTAHLGMGPSEIFPNPYMISEKVIAGDIYLICSDGVTDMVAEKEIQTILEGGKVQKASRKLIKTVLKHGGFDNATMVLIKVIEEGGVEKS